MSWMGPVLILTLVMGVSIAGLIVKKSGCKWDTIARLTLAGLLGTIMAAMLLVLFFIAVWPPYNGLSFILTFGFLGLVAGVLYFVRSTNTPETAELETEVEQLVLADNQDYLIL